MSVSEFPRQLGRYVLYDQIAAGGMATVHFGRMRGAIGFSRLVAIKRLHPNFANDPHFVQMFLDEARLAARLEHPNVVSTIDVVADEAEVFLVMEYVLGSSLEALMPRSGRPPVPTPVPVVAAIVCGVLEGLHSAHEARGDDGAPLDIVHRDVSPHNVLIGVDGVARVFDFGIAKAATNTQETMAGVIKGKVTYMAPEQVFGVVDRRADLYAVGVILWELLAGRRRHAGERNDSLFLKLAKNELDPPRPPSTIRGDVPTSIDDIVRRATDPDPEQRFATAREMAVALEAAVSPAPAREVSSWLGWVAGPRIERSAEVMRSIESDAFTPAPSHAPDPAVSSGSVHAVTATIRQAGLATISTPPHDHASVTEGTSLAAPQRGWTMPAALLAFAAALLLVGLRTLSRHDDDRPRRGGAPAAVVATDPPPPAQATKPQPQPQPQPIIEHAPAPQALPPAKASAAAVVAVPARRMAAPPRVPAARSVTTAPPPPPRLETSSAAPAAATKPGCETPFAIGADGIRQVKPECI